MVSILRFLPVCFLVLLMSQANGQNREHPADLAEVKVRSSEDGTLQPALWYAPEGEAACPLLVALHTWSGDYTQRASSLGYTHWAVAQGWAVIHPNFRGPNWTPEACGSDLAVSDVLDAISYARKERKIDPQRIYAVGVSGGGHMALLMAARAPEIWAGVSAWCGISDLAAWHRECDGSRFERYARHLEAACGGKPDQSDVIDAEYRSRSPLHWLSQEKAWPALDINHGVHDGRTGSVPFTHSLHAFNAAVAEEARISAEEVTQFYRELSFPGQDDLAPDALYGEEPLLFRRIHDPIRVTIFEGGHEIFHLPAMNWLAQQVRGQKPVWDLDPAQIKALPPALSSESGL